MNIIEYTVDVELMVELVKVVARGAEEMYFEHADPVADDPFGGSFVRSEVTSTAVD